MRYCEVCGASFQVSRTCPKDRVPLRGGGVDPFLGRVLGDRYRILERVGAGGMGQVYRAAHTRIACTFAVKVVWGDLAYDPAVQARFVREAEVASCLSSRFIVRVVDFSADAGGVPYLVMEFLDGPTLHDVLVRERALPVARAARLAQRIALGLGHAHDRGVVHRDLKPENVLLVREDDEEEVVKILDFGVARAQTSDRLTSSGMALGTPLYMSPEQIRGGQVDGRSDLYALGVLLAEMVTGTSPFEAPTIEETLRGHLTRPPPSIQEQAGGQPASEGLDALIQRLLQKRPEDRPGSAREVAARLAALLEAMRGGAGPQSIAAGPSSSPVPAEILAAIEETILAGAPLYNAGDHAGCLATYRAAAERMARATPAPAAVVARLDAAVARAATRASATDGAWDLRRGFDDLLFARGAPDAAAQGLPGELAAYGAIAARSEAEGHLDVLGDLQTFFAAELAGRVRARGGDEALARPLEAAAATARQAGGGVAAMVVVEPVLRAISAERGAPLPTSVRGATPPPSGIGPPSHPLATTAPPGAAPASPTARTSLAPGPLRSDLRERILRAIRVGAPAFNEGRHDVCARIYAEAATEIAAAARADPASGPVQGHLERALGEAARRGPTDAAWILRHAFDGLLALD